MNPCFPIGNFDYSIKYKVEDAPTYTAEIETLPNRIKKEVELVPKWYLNTPYRVVGLLEK